MPASVLTTIIGSLILIITGLGFYFAGGMTSITAMIPAFIGFPIFVCGLAATKPAFLKIAMHVAVFIAIVGLLGSMRVFMKWSEMPGNARVSHLILMGVCATLIVVFIGSFLRTRRNRNAPPEGESA